MRFRLSLVAALALLVAGVAASTASANHSWGNYHWARTSNPFTIRVGDNLTSNWDPYLDQAIADWNGRTMLGLLKVAGQSRGKNCRPTAGRMEVCNGAYGSTGWLGIASIWASGSHITQATTKLNDTYFNTPQYNTQSWRRLVTCQEIAHDFGLDHQDETFNNPNLGSCMDYTNDPDGGGFYGPSNEHPNQHDYDQLVTIYSHLDSTTTIASATAAPGSSQYAPGHNDDDDGEEHFERSDHISYTTFYRDFGNGRHKITHVFWALP